MLNVEELTATIEEMIAEAELDRLVEFRSSLFEDRLRIYADVGPDMNMAIRSVLFSLDMDEETDKIKIQAYKTFHTRKVNYDVKTAKTIYRYVAMALTYLQDAIKDWFSCHPNAINGYFKCRNERDYDVEGNYVNYQAIGDYDNDRIATSVVLYQHSDLSDLWAIIDDTEATVSDGKKYNVYWKVGTYEEMAALFEARTRFDIDWIQDLSVMVSQEEVQHYANRLVSNAADVILEAYRLGFHYYYCDEGHEVVQVVSKTSPICPSCGSTMTYGKATEALPDNFNQLTQWHIKLQHCQETV